MDSIYKMKAKEMKQFIKYKSVNYAKKIRHAKYIQYLQHELQTCTTHGLTYIADPELPRLARLFWLVCFSGCLIMIFVLLMPLYTRLKKSPTVMHVEMDYFNWNVSHPAVSLCPQNKPDSIALAAITEQYKQKTGQNLSSYLWTISSASLDNLEIMDLENNKMIPLIPPSEYAMIAATVFRSFNNDSISTSAEWPISVRAALTEMGMCHVINSNVAVFDDPFKWRGFSFRQDYVRNSIELTVHDGDFHTQVTNYADIYKVYIHSPDEVPLSSTPSVTHNEGYFSLRVRVWVTGISNLLRSMPFRTRKCRLPNEVISTRYPVYTYNHCMLECRIRTILRLCGCVPHFYKPLPNETICTLPELQCVVHYKKEISTLSYNPVSMRKLDSHKETFRPSEQCGCTTACVSEVYQIDDEVLTLLTNTKLRVFITAFPKVRIVRHIIFDLYDILLRSGGVVNLCIGSSIISLMELIVKGIRIPLGRIKTVVWERFQIVYNVIQNYRKV